MDDVAGIWRFVRSVRAQERPRLLFFTCVAALVALGQTLGLAGAEALFLTRYGIEYLPQTFVFASVVSILGILLYAALVGSIRNDKMFSAMLWMASAPLATAAYLASRGFEWVLPALMAGYFVTQAIFLNHFWTFASDYFDTLATKRLSHLFTFAASAGGAAGGALVVGLSSVAPPEALIGAWAFSLAAAGLVIRLARRELSRWGLLELIERDETSLSGLASALRFTRTNPLGYWLLASATAMTVALFVSQYLYSEIFVSRFPETSELALFLGAFLMLSNLGEIVIAFAVTPWLTRRLGVGQANLIHPVLTVLSYVALAIDPRLYAGVLARVNREVLDDAMSTTLRHLTYNAISERLRGRIRALVEGIGVYSMMAVAGALIMLDLDPVWLCAVGGSMAVIYLVANLGIRDEYLRTLVDGIREGRIDVAHLSDQLADWEAPRLSELWETLAESGDAQAAISAAQLAPILSARGVVAPLVRSASEGGARVRCACIDALAGSKAGISDSVLLAALADRDSDVRRAAVRALGPAGEDPSRRPGDAAVSRPVEAFDPRLRALMQDESPEVRADAAAALGSAGVEVLLKMTASSDKNEAVAALRRLPSKLADAALERADSSDPAVRAGALEAIARLSQAVSIGHERLARNLDHRNAEVRAAAVTALAATAGTNAESLQSLTAALADPSRMVRTRAVEALRSLGEIAKEKAIAHLGSHAQGTAEAAIEVVSNPSSALTRKLFRSELRSRVREAWGNMLVLASLPERGDLAIRFLRAANEDSMRRSHAISFALLRGLEDPALVKSIERALRLGSPRTRANALEVLSNLGDRSSSHLLVVMLEDTTMEEKAWSLQASHDLPDDLGSALDADRRAFDIWIRMGENYYRKDGRSEISQRDTMERLLLLREIPLFSRLNLDQLEAINLQLRESHYLVGEVVVHEGEPAGELFLLLEGQTRAVSDYGKPHEVTLNAQDAPNYFGEMAILDDRPRSATVVVTAEARLLSLSGESFQDLMLQMPEISFEICRTLSSRVRGLEAEHRKTERAMHVQ